jgi:ribosome-binding factor A
MHLNTATYEFWTMTSPKRSPKRIPALSADVSPDDGVDPRELMRQGRSPRDGRRKAWQLCSQVARTLREVLAGQCDDDLLSSLDVASVEPAPDSSRLLVTIGFSAGSKPIDPIKVLAHLRRASGMLRCEVAAAITRRKVPVLVYCVAEPPIPGGSEA